MKTLPAGSPLRPLFWAVAAFLGGVLLHVDRIPAWIAGVAFAAAAWRVMLAMRGAALPSIWLRALLATLLVLAVLASYRTLNGLAAGTALLVAMGAMKLLETRAPRDAYIMIGAALFLLLAACLDRQQLLRAPLYLLHAWTACAALLVAGSPGNVTGVRMPLRVSLRAIGYALPLALLLFLFFPRLPGSFWALPNSGSAVTGLSDEMSPGDIDSLTDSDAIAFRVIFDGAIPPPQERYWRGPVLHDFDGATWRRQRGQMYKASAIEHEGPAYAYRITLEPHGRNWWFALDTIVESPSRSVMLSFDQQLFSIEPVNQAVTYSAVSHTTTRNTEPLSRLGRRYDTALPGNRNARSRALAADLRRQFPNDRAYVRAVLDLFRTGGFEYTLTPPKLDRDSVDDFLFNTRRGFCGHYASAFATLMRAADVPARVVTGYLGGEWNPIGRYFAVRQSEAHAWVEVWIEGRGWTRVDPTGVVAPERLTQGLYDLIPGAASFTTRVVRESAWITQITQTWDAVNAWWRFQVVDFDLDAQLALLDDLGFEAPDWRDLALLFACAIAAWLAWVAWQSRRGLRYRRRDGLARAYERLSRRLARLGLARAEHEPPLAYAARISAARPALAATAGALVEEYATLRFGRGASAEAVRSFGRRVRAINLDR